MKNPLLIDDDSLCNKSPGKELEKTRCLGRYLLTGRVLGEGGFAKVDLAVDTIDCSLVACKRIQFDDDQDLRFALKELELYRRLNHPNIIRSFYEAVAGHTIFIFLEFCSGGDLLQYINSYGALDDLQAKVISFQTLHALRYLHKRAIAHRDVKPENILLTTVGQYPHVVLADFGLAQTRCHEPVSDINGTTSFLPPEAIYVLKKEKTGYLCMPADCWSAGVTLHIMLTGQHPFLHSASSNSSSHNDDGTSAILDGFSPTCPLLAQKPDATALLCALLNYVPQMRATASSALQNHWLAVG